MRQAGTIFWSSADSIFVSRFCQQISLVSRFVFCQQILSADFSRQQIRFLSADSVSRFLKLADSHLSADSVSRFLRSAVLIFVRGKSHVPTYGTLPLIVG